MTINREHLATQKILDLILDECRYWQGRDEARRGSFAILYAKAKEIAAQAQAATEAEPVEWARRSGRFGCKQYITDRQYQAQSALMKANYEPYSCARCTAPQHDAELIELLRDQMTWHEARDKELSKSGRSDADYHWRRLQHQEQIALIDAKLATLSARP